MAKPWSVLADCLKQRVNMVLSTYKQMLTIYFYSSVWKLKTKSSLSFHKMRHLSLEGKRNISKRCLQKCKNIRYQDRCEHIQYNSLSVSLQSWRSWWTHSALAPQIWFWYSTWIPTDLVCSLRGRKIHALLCKYALYKKERNWWKMTGCNWRVSWNMMFAYLSEVIQLWGYLFIYISKTMRLLLVWLWQGLIWKQDKYGIFCNMNIIKFNKTVIFGSR